MHPSSFSKQQASGTTTPGSTGGQSLDDFDDYGAFTTAVTSQCRSSSSPARSPDLYPATALEARRRRALGSVNIQLGYDMRLGASHCDQCTALGVSKGSGQG